MTTQEEENVMKNTARNLVVLAVIAMALTGLSLAQDLTYQMKANIPFDFIVDGHQLPAGSYEFEVGYGNHVVMLRNLATGRGYDFLAIPGDGDGTRGAVVEFDVYGSNHVLANLKTSSAGVAFHEQKSELASAWKATTVDIVASLR
jgi:hypothetical protein